MELKEYLKIFRENAKFFIGTAVFAVLAGFAYFTLKPASYSTSLMLNITRDGIQQTQDYRYDDFYRLQADEKFAETVVEWLKNPRTVTDVYARAGIDASGLSLRRLGKVFIAEKLSAQIVTVSFSARDEVSAGKISDAVVETVRQNTDSLNENQGEDAWFAIVAQDPVTIRDHIGAPIIFLASMALGLFLGFWLVMARHYLK